MPLSIYDMRDLDLMLRLRDIGDQDGGATSLELAEALGIEDDAQSVAIRATWMRRYGMLDFDPETRKWALSAGGGRVVAAKLKANQSSTIEHIPDEALVETMAHITTRFRLGDPLTATMLRREFQYGTSPRRR